MSASHGSRGNKGAPTYSFHWLRALRITVASLVLLAFTAAFIDYKRIIESSLIAPLAKTQFIPSWQSLLNGVGWGALILFVAFVAGTLVFGRVYCSFLCPFGILQDLIARLARPFKKGKARQYKYAKPVRWIRPLMVALAIAATIFGLGSVFWTWLDPYSQFGRFASFFVRPVLIEGNNAIAASVDHPPAWLYSVKPEWYNFGWAMIPLVMLLLVAFAFAAWRGRLYCNTICPVGSMLGFLSRFSLFRVRIDQGACVKCAMCMKSCRSQCIDLKSGTIDHSRCVNCFDCITVCDGKGISYRPFWDKGGKKDKTPPQKLPVRKCATGVEKTDPSLPILPATDRRTFLGATALGLFASITACAEKKSAGAVKAQYSDKAISPPGSESIAQFLSACTGCQLCVEACPSKCLEPSYMEYGVKGIFKPHLTYREEGRFCQFDCTACSSICPTGAIKPLTRELKHKTAIGRAHLDLTRCIPANAKNDCGACAEHCPVAALEMVRFKQPSLSRGDCVSCLKCKDVCPSGAITYTPGRRKTPIIDYSKCIGCGKCSGICEGSALTMKDSQWNVRVPTLHQEYCIGCGGCESICPPKAVVVHMIPVHETVAQRPVQQVENPNAGSDFPF